MFENFDAWAIVGIILAAAALIGGGVYLTLVKTKLSQAIEVLRQVVELGDVSIAAAEDKKFTAEEKAAIKKEKADVIAAAKKLVGKE